MLNNVFKRNYICVMCKYEIFLSLRGRIQYTSHYGDLSMNLFLILSVGLHFDCFSIIKLMIANYYKAVLYYSLIIH